MATVVQERLAKWNKTSTRPKQIDVESFCLWLGKSKEEIVSEYYAIEKASMLRTWMRAREEEG